MTEEKKEETKEKPENVIEKVERGVLNRLSGFISRISDEAAWALLTFIAVWITGVFRGQKPEVDGKSFQEMVDAFKAGKYQEAAEQAIKIPWAGIGHADEAAAARALQACRTRLEADGKEELADQFEAYLGALDSHTNRMFRLALGRFATTDERAEFAYRLALIKTEGGKENFLKACRILVPEDERWIHKLKQISMALGSFFAGFAKGFRESDQTALVAKFKKRAKKRRHAANRTANPVSLIPQVSIRSRVIQFLRRIRRGRNA